MVEFAEVRRLVFQLPHNLITRIAKPFQLSDGLLLNTSTIGTLLTGRRWTL